MTTSVLPSTSEPTTSVSITSAPQTTTSEPQTTSVITATTATTSTIPSTTSEATSAPTTAPATTAPATTDTATAPPTTSPVTTAPATTAPATTAPATTDTATTAPSTTAPATTDTATAPATTAPATTAPATTATTAPTTTAPATTATTTAPTTAAPATTATATTATTAPTTTAPATTAPTTTAPATTDTATTATTAPTTTAPATTATTSPSTTAPATTATTAAPATTDTATTATTAPTTTAPATTATTAPATTTPATTDPATTSPATTSPATSSTPSPTPPPPPPLTLVNTKIAQTHVLDPQGLSLKAGDGVEKKLTVLGERDALLLYQIKEKDTLPSDFRPQVRITPPGSSTTGKFVNKRVNADPTVLTSQLPSELPGTESKGPTYGADTYSVKIPASLMKPGMKIEVLNTADIPSDPVQPIVTCPNYVDARILPIYLYGIDPKLNHPSNIHDLPAVTKPFLYQQWPVSKLTTDNHPMGQLELPTLVAPPTGSAPAKVVSNSDEFADESYRLVVLHLLDHATAIRRAWGFDFANLQTYLPVFQRNAQGTYVRLNRGIAYVGAKDGDGDYENIFFIHELGHGEGLNHADEEYPNKYPYPAGSLDGSVWGFNFDHNEFLPTTTASNSSRYTRDNCAVNKCYKFDPMITGNDPPTPGYAYQMFSDYNQAIIENFFQQQITYVPTTDSYLKCNAASGLLEPYTLQNSSFAQFGFDDSMPIKRDVPVYTVFWYYDQSETPTCTGCSFIYTPVKSLKGNLLRYLDPTDLKQIQAYSPNRPPIGFYCATSGCDYTLRITYADGSKYVKMLTMGQRPFGQPEDPISATVKDPNNKSSLMFTYENVPGDQVLTKVELLWTPMAWKQVTPSDAKVLLERSF
ncbi:hypothetical protein SAMD00019534_102880 [Acytostelium subglobosum LB1]|uniref:hypothetical protein n=1 Tax=Acytostelium subglobosum LB1 TaxID=1410327 RepID=UPI0006449BAE|nr:hypothetical protein SAMD00019534_102880 [Acytostelium subglobosum LB1]GAM27113.1 hypothetical protein SAMD00019534_102880 [Acytostelium subglobosum LB1]|eukprot:XP_012749993.1 hypothetical protein SAMD00019534_102880 [Acytostelium subglobosum LB1]